MGRLTNAIKALFSKNTTNAASASGARVPIVDVSGDPIGNTSMADLASVLGAATLFSKTSDNGEVETVDANNINQTCAIRLSSSSENVPNFQYENGSWLVTYCHGSNYRIQFAYGRVGDNFTRYKNGSTWSNWVRLYDDSIRSDSTIMSSLAASLGGQLRIRTGSVDQGSTEGDLPQLGGGILIITNGSTGVSLYIINHWYAMQGVIGQDGCQYTITKSARTSVVHYVKPANVPLNWIFIGDLVA